jgi:hypothetical protein
MNMENMKRQINECIENSVKFEENRINSKKNIKEALQPVQDHVDNDRDETIRKLDKMALELLEANGTHKHIRDELEIKKNDMGKKQCFSNTV